MNPIFRAILQERYGDLPPAQQAAKMRPLISGIMAEEFVHGWSPTLAMMVLRGVGVRTDIEFALSLRMSAFRGRLPESYERVKRFRPVGGFAMKAIQMPTSDDPSSIEDVEVSFELDEDYAMFKMLL